MTNRTVRGVVGLAALAAAVVGGRAWGRADEAAANADRVFEMRTYVCHEGKLDDLNKRFRDHTVRLFARYGMGNVGYWTPTDGEAAKNTLVYIVAHKSRDAAKKSWKEFGADAEWQAAHKASHKDGPLVKEVKSVFMKATDYSVIK